MDAARPEFVPDPALSRGEMEALQREIAAAATFEDDFAFDVGRIGVEEPIEGDSGSTGGSTSTDTEQTRLGAAGDEETADGPIVVGVDQAFLDERAIGAIVAVRAGEVIERVHALTPLSIPYIPGLLSFREGGPILAAFEALSVEPDLALFDGSGRIHFRQAGLATHLGLVLDLPSVGVAKSLLCGRPRAPVDGLPEGARVAIEANERVEEVAGQEVAGEAPGSEEATGEVIGYAVQTRQYPSSRRVNPLYVSPGHRVGAETAAEIVLALSAGYKLPEPTRLADRYASEVRGMLRNDE